VSKATIEDGFRLALPPDVHHLVRVGHSVVVTVDEGGRIVLTPEPKALAALLGTFGMWADRDDVPADGVAYMDEIRRGQRLNDLGLPPHEGD
jgi:hypothetical protein